MRSLPFPRSMLCLFPPSLLGLGLGLGFVDLDSALNLKFIGKRGGWGEYNRNKLLYVERAQKHAFRRGRRLEDPKRCVSTPSGEQGKTKALFGINSLMFKKIKENVMVHEY